MKVYVCFFRDYSSQEQHDAAHRLLSLALKREYGIENYTLGKKSHGKPFLNEYPDIKINLSHAKGIAVCSVGKAVSGIDCEQLRTVRTGVVRRVCTDSEAAATYSADNPNLIFTRLWTLKESFVKAVGRGVSYPMKNAEFLFEDENILTNVTGASFMQWVIAEKYIISLCTAGTGEETELFFTNI